MISLFLIVGVYAVFYVLWVYIILPTFLSPLSKIPNAHFTSSFNPFWILWKRYREQENTTIHAAHEKYGKIVRLGPNEVSVASVDDGIRTVYGGGFDKWPWYPNQFDNYGLLPLVDSLSKKREVVDVLELNFSSTMDFVNAFIFGLGNGSNFLQDAQTRRHWLRAYWSRRPFRFWDGELPLAKTISKRLGFPVVPSRVGDATSVIQDWTLERCKVATNWTQTITQGSTGEARTPAIVFDQLTAAVKTTTADDPSLGPPELQVASELLDHLAAGHETSGITLTYLFWELSRNPSLQASLYDELRTLIPCIGFPPQASNSGLPPSRAIDNLPLLHAVLMETLRIHAVIPGPQPRMTPFPPVSVAGSPPLDPGVRVSAQAYSLHRNADIFPDPEVWNPARWLDPSDEKKAEMGRWFWAFGSGGRKCIGSNLAMQEVEMKLITAAIFSNFTTHIVDDRGIEQVDAYTAGPKNHRLMLRFERKTT
ncbi:MAG: hypothetical protein Q9217_006308 [Psora testacea]